MIQQHKHQRQPLEINSKGNDVIFHRTTGRFNADYVLKDVHKFFEKKYKMGISYGIFAKVCQEFNEFAMDEIVKGCGDFYMPCRLGSIGIRKMSAKPYMIGNVVHVEHIPIDYRETKALWARNEEARERRQLVRVSNKHTDGYKYRFVWDKSTAIIPNLSIYKFVATRTNKRDKLAKALKSDNKPETYERVLL